MNFNHFKTAVAKQFDRMVKNGVLFRTSAKKDEMWNTYLTSFPEGTNPILKTHTEHDCNCCKQFIRAVGDVVAIIDGKLESIWDGEVKGEPGYQVVSQAMATLVKSHPIEDEFLHYEKTAGTSKNFQQTVDGVVTWEHFFINIPEKFVLSGKDIPTRLNLSRTKHGLFVRGLEELSVGALNTVLELIDQDSLYRGKEHKFAVTKFLEIKHLVVNAAGTASQLITWPLALSLPGSVTGIKNNSIGTLLSDLSEGLDLEDAVKKFESVVAPTNYKRPKALISQSMINKAKETLEKLGLVSALERRYATISDITINNVLFADRSAKPAMAGGIFDTLAPTTPTSTKSFDKVEEVPIAKFITDILPKATGLEIFVENGHQNNFVTLIAPVDPTAPGLFKWNNGFSWSYNGDVADSLREKVMAAGGRVDGVLRFTHSWNHVGRNASLMDLHVFMPGSSAHADCKRDYYPIGQRVGWNCRSDAISGGVQDVDYTGAAPEGYIPVENITFPSLSKLREGKYTFKIHNWALRAPTTSGFRAEIEFEGQVFQYEYPRPLGQKEWVTVAEATLKNGRFTIDHKIPHGASTRNIWGIPTQSFQKVKTVMKSPNFWDGQLGIGNEHTFFMLENCKNEGKARGFYNEFLKSELDQHRKVIEVVGSKMKTEESEQQLSGLGFSSTQRNSVLCKVTGSFSRVIKIVF